jgi:PBP1b-binding outer membrane lipoprotein LpoB
MKRYITFFILLAYLFAGCGSPAPVEPIAEEEAPDTTSIAAEMAQSPANMGIEAVGADTYNMGAKTTGSILVNRMKLAGS